MRVLEKTDVDYAEVQMDSVAEAPVSRVQVEKRDGRVVDFDSMNIIMAITAAFKDLGKEVGPQEEQMIRDISDHIEAEIQDRYNGPAKIEDIQTLVEHSLIENHLYEVARCYTSYRLNRDIDRAKATDINEAVNRLVNRDETLVRETQIKIPMFMLLSAIFLQALFPRHLRFPCFLTQFLMHI